MTTVTVIGCLDKFHIRKGNFDYHIKRMEQYFVANAVSEEKQVATFLTVIGGSAYELLQNLVSPATPKDNTLTDLKSIFCMHLKLKPLTIAEHFKFHKHTQ